MNWRRESRSPPAARFNPREPCSAGEPTASLLCPRESLPPRVGGGRGCGYLRPPERGGPQELRRGANNIPPSTSPFPSIAPQPMPSSSQPVFPRPCQFFPKTNSAKADEKCEVWNMNKMTKPDDEAQQQLWYSRMYTAPMLLEEPSIYWGEGGDLSSPDVGR